MQAMLCLAFSSASALRMPVVTRRSIVDAGFAVAVWPLAAPLASALSTEPSDSEIVPGQTSNVQRGVLDVNNSPVADYMQFPGLYPTVAGKVATHGPYKKVKDVYGAASQHVEDAVAAVAHLARLNSCSLTQWLGCSSHSRRGPAPLANAMRSHSESVYLR